MAPDRTSYGLGRAELQELYAAMCLNRAAEERLEVLQKQGHVPGGLYRSLGQEAGSVGAAFALRRAEDGTGDVLAPTVRAAGAIFLFGAGPIELFRQYTGRATGPTGGREANVHFIDLPKGILGPVSPLGTMIEVMAGVTLTFRMRGEERIGLVMYGEGASSTGAWHEGVNFAAVQRCPLVIVVENNQWAFSTPLRKTTRLASLTAKGPGYGIDAEAVDGTDVLAVFDTVRRAAVRARAGDGAQLVELRYFRRLGHAQHDPHDYVAPELIAEWERKDPIETYRRRLVANGWATEPELVALEEDAHERCRLEAERVLAEPLPDGPFAGTDVYTDVPARRPWTRAGSPDPRAA